MYMYMGIKVALGSNIIPRNFFSVTTGIFEVEKIQFKIISESYQLELMSNKHCIDGSH